MKKILYGLTAAAVAVNTLFMGGAFAQSSKVIDMSFEKNFAASTQNIDGSISELTNGITGSGGVFLKASGEEDEVWISVDLKKEYDIKSIDLYPQSGNGAAGFPKQIKVLTAKKADFSDAAAVYESEQDLYSEVPGGAINVELTAANGRYVKIVSVKNGNVGGEYGMGFSEVCVNADTYSEPQTVLISQNKPVYIAQSISSSWYNFGTEAVAGRTTNPAQLTDGNYSTVGGYGSSNTTINGYSQYAPNVYIYFIVDLGEEYDLSRVDITPRKVENGRYGSYYPVRLDILEGTALSETDKKPTLGETLYSSSEDEYDFNEEKNVWGAQTAAGVAVGPTEKQSYVVSGHSRYVVIRSTKNAFIANGGNGVYNKYIWPHFAEIEIYGSKARENTTELVSSGKTFNGYALDYAGKVISGSTQENLTVLTDGIDSRASRAVAKGNFSTASYTRQTQQICFETDLGSILNIKQVKLFPDTFMNYGSRFPIGFVLEASDNADFSDAITLYETDEYWKDPNEWYASTAKVKAGPMEPQAIDVSGQGRYFRIRTTANSASYNGASDAQGYVQIGFTEIEVYAGDDFVISNRYYKNGTDAVGSGADLSDAATLRVHTEIKNNTGYTQNAVVLRALYKDNKMIDISVKRLLFSDSAVLDDVTFTLPDGDEGSYVVKTMLWESIKGLKPYVNNTVFPK